MHTKSSHQAYRSQGNRFAPQSIAMLQVRLLTFAISTSLIQCIVIWGSTVLVHSSFLKLAFQLWNSIESRHFPRFYFEIASYHCENEFHQYDSTGHSNSGSGVKEFACSTILFPFHSLFSLLFRQHQASNPVRRMPNSLNCWRLQKKVLLEASGRSKTFPVIPVPFWLSHGNPESQRGKVLGLRTVEAWSGTWVAPELLPDSGS